MAVNSDQMAFEAWRAYVSVGRLDAPLLRESVHRAWERCHLAGADPRRMRPEMFSRTELECLLDANDPLVRAARPYLRALSRAAGSERHAALLGDAQAVLLDVRGDDASIHGPERVPSPGSLLAEAHAGANGVATPLADDRYVELVGPEHFMGGFHAFTCLGLPLRGADGETVGSLSVSSRTQEAAQRLRRILKVAARGVEADMIVARLRTRLCELPRGAEWPQLERLHQDLLQIHATSRLEFELAAHELSLARDAKLLIDGARDLIERFTRLSRLWQILAEPEIAVNDELDADQLVHDSSDLMQTEARLAGVTLRSGTTSCGRVRRVHQVVRTLVHAHMSALGRAGWGGVVEVSTDERGRVQWTMTPVEGPQHSLHYQLRVVPS